jgi:uncharacterized protein (TIGR03545 family)
MIRWKYLLPRLLVLATLATAVVFFTVPLARLVLLDSAQAVTGARVEAQIAEASLWRGRLCLRDLQIADPDEPMSNLVQADMIELELDPAGLLQRRWVINHGRLQGVRFGTPRNTSGALPSPGGRRPWANLPAFPQLEAKPLLDEIRTRAGDLLELCDDQLPDQWDELAEGSLESAGLSRELKTRWKAELLNQQRRAEALQQRARDWQTLLQQDDDNPLRNAGRLQDAALSARQLLEDVQTAHREVHALGDRFQRDRQRLRAASERDLEKIRQLAGTVRIRPQPVVELLLSDRQQELLWDTVRWLQWYRNIVPDSGFDWQPPRQRGFDIRFRDYPALWFRTLDLQGESCIAGQSVEFRAQLHDISTAPARVSRPWQYRLSTAGPASFTVEGSVDRRGPRKIDHLRVECQRLPVAAMTLGQSGTLALDMDAGHAELTMHANLTDDRLSGQIRLRQSGVALQVAAIQPLEGAADVAETLNQGLAEIDQFSLAIDLRGTLDEPQAGWRSDLGEQVADRLSQALGKSLKTAANRRVAEMQQRLDQQFAELDRLFYDQTGQLLERLQADKFIVAELEKLRQPSGWDGSRIRRVNR